MSESVVTVNPGELKFASESVSSCNICGETLNLDKNELYWHIRMQHLRLGWPAVTFKCELCGAAYIKEIGLKVHIRERHRSSPKPPIEETDGEHNLEVGKTSKDEENTDIGTIYASPKAPIEEIDDKHDEEVAKAQVIPKFVNESGVTLNMGELKMSIISELSNDKYDEDVNEFQSRYEHKVIRYWE